MATADDRTNCCVGIILLMVAAVWPEINELWWLTVFDDVDNDVNIAADADEWCVGDKTTADVGPAGCNNCCG